MRKGKSVLDAFLVLLFAIILGITSYGITDTKRISSINEDNREVVVAVIDTGLNIDDTIDESRIIRIEGNHNDEIGHGTKIVQLIQNNTNDRVSIMPVKVVNANGSASIGEVCKGIRKVADNGADIINLSMNTVFYTDSTELEELITELYEKGIFVIVSAGNESEDTKYLAPANIDKAVVVGAMTDSREPYFYSNYGESVDLSALGSYDGDLGTSFASAYVTSYYANLMAEGYEDIEYEVSKNLERISEKEYGDGYLKWKDRYTGETNKEKESEIYLGKRDKTLNEKTCDILETDWRGLSREELDAVIGETDYKYVGLLLSRMSESDLEAVMEKSHILNTNVNRLDMEYDADTSEYIVSNQIEIGYAEYCLNEYEKEKEKMLLTSDWDCRTQEAVMYISSPDRQKIYKYVITGLYEKSWVMYTSWNPGFETRHLSITSSVYKDGNTSYQFTKPTPINIYAYYPNTRAIRVDTYKADGTFLYTRYHWDTIDTYTDNGNPYIGISIEFNNYTNKKTGYHNTENSVVMYNAGDGIGTSTREAMTYMHDYGDYANAERNFVNFEKVELGYNIYWYNGRFKDGYNSSNATTIEESLDDWEKDRRDNIYISTGQTTIDDTSGTFTINIIPPISLGTKWHQTYDGKLMTESDIPEIVFNLAPNTYTVKFNGNGATGGSTADQSMIYDSGYYLNSNSFYRDGYVFNGWNTSPDGNGTWFNNSQWVSNLTDVNGGVVTLYAQWREVNRNYVMTIDYNYGSWNSLTSSSYTVTIGTSNYYCLAGTLPLREGYTFNGFWTDRNNGTQIFDKNGYCINEGTYWSNNVWNYNGNATFYAQWIPNNYTLTLNHNGGTYHGSTSNDYTVVYGVSDYYDVSWGLPSREGYMFNGYWTSPIEGTQIYTADGFCINNGICWYDNKWCNPNDVTLYAQWKANYYNVNLIAGYGIETVSSSGENQNTDGKYAYGSEVTITAKEVAGFHFLNWNGMLGTIGNQTYTFHMPANDVTMTANGEANSYVLVFHPDDGGEVTPIENRAVKYDETVILPNGGLYYVKYTLDGVNITDGVLSGAISLEPILLKAESKEQLYEMMLQTENAVRAVLDAYPSVFKGWLLESEKGLYTPAWQAEMEVPVKTIIDNAGMTQQNGAVIILYAVWDDCPWIAAQDLYFTLQEAQSGFITYDDLMSRVAAYDREDGSKILPGEDVAKGTSFKLIDYQEEAFTGLTADGSVTVTYRVIDSSGNMYEKMSTVYIVDSTPQMVKPDGTTRFINEKYYYESYKNGGLQDNSVWKTDPEYVEIIIQAFENSKNDTPMKEFHFTQEEIRKMKEFP